jgi:competence protein ComEC
MNSQRTKVLLSSVGVLVVTIVLTLLVLHRYGTAVHSDKLRLVLLDIGQGDAIYIEAPNGRQMIIDGGPKDTLMGELAKVMPRGDRSIDAIVITNPDADHMHGFISLLREYSVGAVLEPGTQTHTQTYAQIESGIADKQIPRIIARAGMRVVLDPERNIYYEVLFPDRDVSHFSTNDGSIVGRLVYGTTSYLLTGDANFYTESLIEARYGSLLASDVLKVGHHGSRTSTGDALLDMVHPALAIISAGFHNSYGHPTKEVLGRLTAYGIPYYVTIDKGNIEVDSDGTRITEKFEK